MDVIVNFPKSGLLHSLLPALPSAALSLVWQWCLRQRVTSTCRKLLPLQLSATPPVQLPGNWIVCANARIRSGWEHVDCREQGRWRSQSNWRCFGTSSCAFSALPWLGVGMCFWDTSVLLKYSFLPLLFTGQIAWQLQLPAESPGPAGCAWGRGGGGGCHNARLH